MGIAKHLDLDMARALHVFFNQHSLVTKTVFGLALAAGQRGVKIFGFFDNAHAFAATACAGFDEHRVADGTGLALQQGRVLVGTVVAGYQGHPGRGHQAFGFCLQPHGVDGRCRRADKHQTGLGAGMGKVFVFAQETVAGVNRLCPGVFGRLDDALPTQIAVFGSIAANVHGFVAHLHVFGTGVGIRIYSHRFDGQFGAGGSHPAGDFTAIGDQDFVKHQVVLVFPAMRQWPQKSNNRQAQPAPRRPSTADAIKPPAATRRHRANF